MPKKYVLVSIIRTKDYDRYICFWRANNAGYTECFDVVGIYEVIEDGYHNSETTKPIEMSVFQSLQTEISDGCVKVLNNEKNLQIITDYEYNN